MEVGGRGRLYTYRCTVTTRMTCIKMGSDESHFNVSVGSDGQSHKTVSTNHNLEIWLFVLIYSQPENHSAWMLPGFAKTWLS